MLVAENIIVYYLSLFNFIHMDIPLAEDIQYKSLKMQETISYLVKCLQNTYRKLKVVSMAVAKYSQRRDSGNEIRRLILILNLHIILQKIRKCQFSSLIKQPLHIHVYVHGWGKRSSNNENQVDIKIPNKGTAKECSNCHTVTLISYTSKVILKILQARVQEYVNQELSDVQAGFRKGRRIRNQIANTHWITEKVREFQKNIYFCFIDHTEVFDYMDHKKTVENS